MPAALVGDHVSDNDLGFSSASGMSHSNEDMNENMLSDLPPLITFSPLELESSALNYHETLNKGTPEEKARGNCSLVLVDFDVSTSYREHAGLLF
jgi:hypothetical protein